jgi:MFS family permease
MNKFRKYPKEVYVIWFISFLTGIELIGAILIPFFKGWGGLNQFQIQLLQSFFTLAVFFLEIPTGIIGDIKGRKFSILCGALFLVVGPLVYGSMPDFRIFLLAELLFAIGIAFNSGAEEALLYDTLKEKKLTKDYSHIQNVKGNIHLIGMLVSSLFTGIALQYLSINRIFQLASITWGLTFILILIFIKEPKVKLQDDFVPDYKVIFKRAVNTLRYNKKLKKLVLFITLVSSATYFVIWFNQVLLQTIGVEEEKFGFFRIVLILSQIVLSAIIIRLFKSKRKIGFYSRLITALIVFGFISFVFLPNVIGVLIFIVLAGGIGMKFRSIFSEILNQHIRSSERATTLSFISMIRRLSLTMLNPVFGWLADVDMDITLLILASVVVFAGALLLPTSNLAEK